MSFGGSVNPTGSLSTASDVVLSNPAVGHVLAYDGVTGKWRNQLTGDTVTALDASKITSGTLAAARIPDLSSLYAKVMDAADDAAAQTLASDPANDGVLIFVPGP